VVVRTALSMVMVATVLCSGLIAQTAPPPLAEFDVVSIKRNTGAVPAGGMRTLPDGSFTMTNQLIRSIIEAAAPVPVRDVIGLPAWATSERYDIIAKAPEGSLPAQRDAMMRAMILDRLKLVAHVEQQERGTLALVLARSDGRLGPQLKPSSLDCTPRPVGSPPPPIPAGPPSVSEMQSRCGVSIRPGQLVSGGVTMDRLARSLPTGGVLVNNRTGLQGEYAVTLNFSRPRGPGAEPPSLDEPPEVFTALQEQLGLKLIAEKSMVPVLVIDHIERPSED
jgi:uncharacterized protein (TIGR03435 family)